MDLARCILGKFLGAVCHCFPLQHKDYDNNLVKGNCWTEVAGERYAQDMELSRRTQYCR
jgi:hypothetical protein